MLDQLFARNTRRKKNAERGNYAFRSRRRRVRLNVRRLDLNPETAATLREMGFMHAVALDGGMKTWRESGYPVKSGREP